MGGTGSSCSSRRRAHLHQVDQAAHVLFYPVQPAQAVQLGQQLLQGFGGLRLRFGGGRGLLLPRRGGGGGLAGLVLPPPCDKVPGIQLGLVRSQPVCVAQGGEGVGAGVDEARLPVADCPVGGGEQQQHQRQQIHEPPGGLLAVRLVILPHPLEKHRRPEAGILGHGGAQLPVQGGGDRISLAVDAVVILHMLGRNVPPVGLPHAQSALAHEFIHVLVELLPHRGIGDVLPERGHPFVILPVHCRGGHCPLHRPHSF